MPRIEIPFTGSSKQHRSPAIANQICRNYYPEIIKDDQGKQAFRVLIGSPGKSLLSAVSNMPIRGLHMSSSKYLRYWAVFGDTFYEFLPNGTFTTVGKLQTNQSPVYIADNGTHIMIVDSSNNGYVYDIVNSVWNADLATTSGNNFIGGDYVIYMDGYFIVIQPGSNILQSCTAPYGTAPSVWKSDDKFSTSLVDAGPLIALGVIHDVLWAFGDYNISLFQNTSNAVGFPLSIVPGTSLPVGLSSRAGLKELNGTLMWPGKTKKGAGRVYQSNGLSYATISDPELEHIIGSYPATLDAYGDVYIEEGHSFYLLTYPTGNQTWVFDQETREWHERNSYGLGRDRSRGHIYFEGKHIVGDDTTGNLYTNSLDVYTENSQPLVATRRCQHIKRGLDPIEIPGIVIDAEVGVGTSPMVQGFDPQMVLRYSPDGGRTWSDDIEASMGQLGDYKAQIRYPRLGTGTDWVFEIMVSDPVRRNIIGAYVEA